MLREWQAAMAAHLLADTPVPDRRLAIHRHHVASSLARALAVSFPTVMALVGAGFFREAARRFVVQNPPRQPVLAEYGAGFAGFLAGWAPARDLPYLADMARLDWALNMAFHSPPGDPLDAATLAAIPARDLARLSLALAPGVALVRSAYPIDLVWKASQPNAGDEPVDLGRGPVRLLVLRQADGAAFASLEEGEAVLAEALAAGRSIETAAGIAAAAEPGFDLSRAFARLSACEVFAAMQHPSPEFAAFVEGNFAASHY